MKTIRIEVEGTDFRVYEDNIEINNVLQFMVKGGREYCPSIEYELALVDNTPLLK